MQLLGHEYFEVFLDSYSVSGVFIIWRTEQVELNKSVVSWGEISSVLYTIFKWAHKILEKHDCGLASLSAASCFCLDCGVLVFCDSFFVAMQLLLNKGR